MLISNNLHKLLSITEYYFLQFENYTTNTRSYAHKQIFNYTNIGKINILFK